MTKYISPLRRAMMEESRRNLEAEGHVFYDSVERLNKAAALPTKKDFKTMAKPRELSAGERRAKHERALRIAVDGAASLLQRGLISDREFKLAKQRALSEAVDQVRQSARRAAGNEPALPGHAERRHRARQSGQTRFHAARGPMLP
jgi:hypothetical protein